jgi:hypothetical protein
LSAGRTTAPASVASARRACAGRRPALRETQASAASLTVRAVRTARASRRATRTTRTAPAQQARPVSRARGTCSVVLLATRACHLRSVRRSIQIYAVPGRRSAARGASVGRTARRPPARSRATDVGGSVRRSVIKMMRAPTALSASRAPCVCLQRRAANAFRSAATSTSSGHRCAVPLALPAATRVRHVLPSAAHGRRGSIRRAVRAAARAEVARSRMHWEDARYRPRTLRL